MALVVLGSSVRVTVRVFDMPIPGRLHNLVEVREARLPPEFGRGLLCGGDEAGRISRAAVFLHHRDGSTRNPPAGFDDFAHRETRAVAQIEEAMFAGSQGLDVGLSQIGDVNVVECRCRRASDNRCRKCRPGLFVPRPLLVHWE